MKLTKKLLAMALAGVMLLTILTGCSGGKTGDRLVEEYLAAYYHSLDVYEGIPITTNDVPEIKTVAEMFKTSETSWLKADGSWAFSPRHPDDPPRHPDDPPSHPDDPRYKALQDVFSKYSSGYTVNLYAFEVDSKQSELNQAMRVMSPADHGLSVYPSSGWTYAIQCATRLVTRENKSYRIVVIIYDNHT